MARKGFLKGKFTQQNVAMLIVFMTVFIDTMGASLIIPIMPFYVLEFGGSSTELGYLISVYAGMSVVSMLFMGPLSDKIGRRPTILMSLTGSGISFVLQGIAWNYWSLFAFRALGGLFAGTITVAQAFVADIVPEPQIPKYMGLIGAVFALAYLFGPSIGSGLSEFGINIPLYVSGGMAAIGFVFALFKLPESKVKVSDEKDSELEELKEVVDEKEEEVLVESIDFKEASVRNQKIHLFYLIAFMNGNGFTGFITLFALYTAEVYGLTSLEIGFAFTAMAACSVLGQTAGFNTLRSRFGLKLVQITFLGNTLAGLGLFFIPYPTENVWLCLLCGLVMFIGYGLFSPTIPSLLSGLADHENQGKILGRGRASDALARVVAPTVIGIIYEYEGAKIAFIVSALGCWIAAIIAFFIHHRWEHPEESAVVTTEFMMTALRERQEPEDLLPELDEESQVLSHEIGEYLCRMLTHRNYRWQEHVPGLKTLLAAEFPPLVDSEEDADLHHLEINDIIGMAFQHNQDYSRSHNIYVA